MSVETVNSISIEVKSLSDEGEFTGIASVTGNVDLGGDIMQPGAFTKTIAERGNKVRLMDNHKVRIGMAIVSEVPEGLLAAGRINIDKQSGKDALSDLKFYRDHGLPMGMSIGYQTVKADFDAKGNRLLKEVKLYEVTVTELPMNESAQVTSVKSFHGMLNQISAEVEVLKQSGLTPDSKRRAVQLISQLIGAEGKNQHGELTNTQNHRHLTKDDFTEELDDQCLQDMGNQMRSALFSALSSVVTASDLTKDERVAAAGIILQQFSAAYLEYLPKYLDWLTEEYGDDFMTMGAKPHEKKTGRMISATNQNTISSALGKMRNGMDQHKSAMDDLQALIDDGAEDCDPEEEDCGTTSKSKAANKQKALPEPVVVDHSATVNLLNQLQVALATR